MRPPTRPTQPQPPSGSRTRGYLHDRCLSRPVESTSRQMGQCRKWSISSARWRSLSPASRFESLIRALASNRETRALPYLGTASSSTDTRSVSTNSGGRARTSTISALPAARSFFNCALPARTFVRLAQRLQPLAPRARRYPAHLPGPRHIDDPTHHLLLPRPRGRARPSQRGMACPPVTKPDPHAATCPPAPLSPVGRPARPRGRPGGVRGHEGTCRGGWVTRPQEASEAFCLGFETGWLARSGLAGEEGR